MSCGLPWVNTTSLPAPRQRSEMGRRRPTQVLFLRRMSTRPAQPARGFRRDDSVGVFPIVLVLVLIAGPSYALSRLATWLDCRLLVGVALALSLFTYFAHRSDKRCAQSGERRIPESVLHLAELAGGWPGAFLAQRNYRHKISKISYQVIFWVIVLSHQFVAFDSLTNWRLTKGVLHLIKSHAA